METVVKESLYEVEFESLEIKELEKFENKDAILNAKLDISVTLGKCKKSIKDILNLKNGDIICLDKVIDEDLDIKVNDKCIAKGESIRIEEKISVRIIEFKKSEN
ncbi:FliM/FliN family flagellar motor switch protein [Clostridium sp. D53t1_180928_C8]|uniref:FliM/FliN family flagellar motor switch protein n=1 Tax=Clostridium sp. D53t1_180928_C8 TaxID=2787101 RepID=UPI0018AA80DF|nr:FliM/FliN family flagellar motor switch protein [Clostridium sp. D53t1_180928_C8]